MGKEATSFLFLSWKTQLSPIARARQFPSSSGSHESFRTSPTTAEKAPLRTFSSVYQGIGLREANLSQRSRRSRRLSENSSPSTLPLQKARTNSVAHMPADEVSVAPAPTPD